MAGIRVRWAVLGRVAAIAATVVALLQILPGLLRAPEPPPLAADVGLPQPQPVPRVQRDRIRAKETADREARRKAAVAARRPGGPAAATVIGSFPRGHHAAAPGPKAPRAAPVPVAARSPEPPPPAAPVEVEPQPPYEPAPVPASEPAPAPNDGSVEFAPH